MPLECTDDMENKVVYSVADVARMTGLSARTITRMFENERGVIVLERPESAHKRRYRSIRIPRAVYERVVRKITVSATHNPRIQQAHCAKPKGDQ